MTGETFLIVDGERRGPLAYQGKEGCESVLCTVVKTDEGWRCVGWHCAYCDKPCSYQGHGCDVAEAILGVGDHDTE